MEAYRREEAVAIVGMAARFPGADDLAGFWRNLLAGRESVRYFSTEELVASGESEEVALDRRYVPARAVLTGADRFDSAFFGFTDGEAELTDLQQRMLLETAWRAFEDAGRIPGPHPRTGLFIGARENRFAELVARGGRHGSDRASLLRLKMGSDSDFIATRIAYRFDLRGPCLTVQTACSSSLIAVHLATRALFAGDCDLALAGGVSIRVPLDQGYLWEDGLIDSVDGHCRAFDDAATGTVGGDGVGVVVLRRLGDALRDGDAVHAVIRGSAVNNDGSDKLGFTAPSVSGQVDLMRAGLSAAGVEPHRVGYVECHGTGTKLGDPIELRALHAVFGRRADGRCLIGSVKTNIGHLDAAAGVAGLIKAALAVRHGIIPPSLHLRTPNRAFDWSASRLRVCQEVTGWPDARRPRTAAVSSLGLGGTNAFVVLEEEPAATVREAAADGGRWYALPLSARSAEALERAGRELAGALEAAPAVALGDVAFTLGSGRRQLPYRRVVACRTTSEASARLRVPLSPLRPAGPRPRCVFLFPGHGVDPRGTGRHLYRADPAFAEALDGIADLVRERARWDLREVVCGEPAGVPEPGIARTQVCLFAVSHASAAAVRAWGVEPDAVVGHSVGEIAAACVAGVLSLPDAVALVADRAEACEQRCAEGAMLAVALPEERLAARAADSGCAVSAVNAPSQSVVSGPVEAVARLAEALRGDRIPCAPVRSRRAFHSPAMRPAALALDDTVKALRPRPARVPIVSTVTGTYAGDAMLAPDYWQRQLLSPVRLDAALRAVAAAGTAYLDVGPGRALCRLAASHLRRGRDSGAAAALHPGSREGDAEECFIGAVATLWTAGVPVRWDRRPAGARRVSLPGHPLSPKRYPVPLPAPPGPASTSLAAVPPVASVATDLTGAEPTDAGRATGSSPVPWSPLTGDGDAEVIAAVFEEIIGAAVTGPDESFFALGGDSLMAVQAIVRISDALGVELTVDDLFRYPTVRELAEHLGRAAAG